MKKNCVICDAEFEFIGKGKGNNTFSFSQKMYCGKRCRQIAQNNQRREKRQKIMATCPICDVEFEKRGSKKYCSLDCYNASRREKWRNTPDDEREKINAERRARANRDYIHIVVKPKPCAECGTIFVGYRNDTSCCGEECRKKRHIRRGLISADKRREKKFGPIVDRICEICNESFTPSVRNSQQLTCSQKCLTKKRNLKRKSTIKGRISSRIRSNLRGRLRKRNTTGRGGKTFDLLGYTPADLIKRMESQFTDGMSWENMSEWHIDHIRPVASFNYDSTDHPEFKECWALENLQPMWKLDNLSKGSLWEGKRHRHKVVS